MLEVGDKEWSLDVDEKSDERLVVVVDGYREGGRSLCVGKDGKHQIHSPVVDCGGEGTSSTPLGGFIV